MNDSEMQFRQMIDEIPALAWSCLPDGSGEFLNKQWLDYTGLSAEAAPDFALAVFKGLSHVAPHAHVLHLKNEDFSRDPRVVAQMNADALIAHETQPTQTLAEMVRADERLKASFQQITLPVLILHGTAD